ncbi:MAG: hypothetical protein KJ990_02370 [Proteobacteria bacterium]|nr:hypothetical protein [Pseudomonadota bacterium]
MSAANRLDLPMVTACRRMEFPYTCAITALSRTVCLMVAASIWFSN